MTNRPPLGDLPHQTTSLLPFMQLQNSEQPPQLHQLQHPLHVPVNMPSTSCIGNTGLIHTQQAPFAPMMPPLQTQHPMVAQPFFAESLGTGFYRPTMPGAPGTPMMPHILPSVQSPALFASSSSPASGVPVAAAPPVLAPVRAAHFHSALPTLPGTGFYAVPRIAPRQPSIPRPGAIHPPVPPQVALPFSPHPVRSQSLPLPASITDRLGPSPLLTTSVSASTPPPANLVVSPISSNMSWSSAPPAPSERRNSRRHYESDEQREACLKADRERMRRRRGIEAERLAKAKAGLCENADEVVEKIMAARRHRLELAKRRRNCESPQRRMRRLQAQREQKRRERLMETPERREQRLEKERARKRQKKQQVNKA